MFILEAINFNFGFASQKFLSILETKEFWILDNRENKCFPFESIKFPFESILVLGSMVLGPKSLHLISVLFLCSISSEVYARNSVSIISFPITKPQFVHTISPSIDVIAGSLQHFSLPVLSYLPFLLILILFLYLLLIIHYTLFFYFKITNLVI